MEETHGEEKQGEEKQGEEEQLALLGGEEDDEMEFQSLELSPDFGVQCRVSSRVLDDSSYLGVGTAILRKETQVTSEKSEPCEFVDVDMRACMRELADQEEEAIVTIDNKIAPTCIVDQDAPLPLATLDGLQLVEMKNEDAPLREQGANEDAPLREQVAKASSDLVKTRRELKETRRYCAGLDRRLRSKDWNHYAEELTRACQEVENWRSTIELERANIVSSLKKEVHGAFSRELDSFNASLRTEILEKQRSHYNEELARACTVVETWRNAIEQERKNIVSSLTQEVHDALSKNMSEAGIPVHEKAPGAPRSRSRSKSLDDLSKAVSSACGEISQSSAAKKASEIFNPEESERDSPERLIEVVSQRIDARIDRLTNSLEEESTAIRRVELKCEDMSSTFEGGLAGLSGLKSQQSDLNDAMAAQNIKMDLYIAKAETAVKRLEEQVQSMSVNYASPPEPMSPMSPLSPSRTEKAVWDDAPKRMDFMDFQRRALSGRSEQWPGSAASTGPDLLSERVDDLRVCLNETELTVQRVSKQCEDVIRRMEIDVENQSRWREVIQAQGDERNDLIRRLDDQNAKLAAMSELESAGNESSRCDLLQKRVDDMRVGLDETELTVQRVSKQCEDVLHRLEAEVASHQRAQEISEAQGDERNDLIRRLDDQNAKLAAMPEFASAGNDSSRCDLLQERLDDLRTGLNETELTVQRVARQCEDVLHRLEAEAESHERMQESIVAQGEEHDDLIRRLDDQDAKQSAAISAAMSELELLGKASKRCDLLQELHDLLQERVDDSRVGFNETELTVQRASKQCDDVLHRMEAQVEGHQRTREIIEAQGEERSDLSRRLDDHAAKLSELEFASSASKGCDLLQERVDGLREGLSETELSVQRVSKQCEDVLHRLEAEAESHQRTREIIEAQGEERSDLIRRLDDQNAKLSARSELEFASNASTGCDLLQERVDDLRAGLNETELSVQRVSKQCGDVLRRVESVAESHQRTREIMDAQGEDSRKLGNMFSLLTQDWASLQEQTAAHHKRFLELEESVGSKLSADTIERAPLVQKISTQLIEVKLELAMESGQRRSALEDLAEKLEVTNKAHGVKGRLEFYKSALAKVDVPDQGENLRMKAVLTDCIAQTLRNGHGLRDFQGRLEALENRHRVPEPQALAQALALDDDKLSTVSDAGSFVSHVRLNEDQTSKWNIAV